MEPTAAPGVAVPDAELQRKYILERDKRLRTDGANQFLRLAHADSGEHQHLQDDPWADHAALNAAPPALTDGAHTKFLILGGGFGGLVFAARLVEGGFAPDGIRIVDDAGGFGGTWYWNRYPGLMCDTESYIYMPLLEETGYMPKHRYAYGEELRLYAERIAEKYGLVGKALFRTRYTKATWEEPSKRWSLTLSENRGPDTPPISLTVTAQFIFTASGTLNWPQIPRLDGLDTFAGKYFHTSRWHYEITGGSPSAPADGNGHWDLPLLAGKRVGIIGTGATAIQVVPQLARNAEHLYVFQRTPSSVDARGQRKTDPEVWKSEIATGPGWQEARMDNFHMCLANVPQSRPEGWKDLVDDGWTWSGAYMALVGGETTLAGPGIVPPTPEGIAAHLAALHTLDLQSTSRIRARVDEIVKDKTTAEKLKAYYPTWCKRPTFHDEYLPSFNRANVTLVDTDGRGVERVTPTGIVVAGVEYPVDVLVLSTGYITPAAGSGSPAARACIEILGRGGKNMDTKWLEGAGTLHGVASHDFPNLFFPGPSQAGVSSNFTSALSGLARHVACVLKVAHEKAPEGTDPDKLVVEVTKEAEEAWSMQVMMRSAWFAAVGGCTPGYINNEGDADRMTMEQKMLRGRMAPWGEGIRSFWKVLEKWREEGKLEGYVLS
ncbi:FAD/NAD(P)-binding domain-containing protein [Mycena kentingensis (nom. inval.)]|nr:FAD/NAD(P)-binding domain-containing protein [Mycena kentingensis (nom. inval.)]